RRLGRARSGARDPARVGGLVVRGPARVGLPRPGALLLLAVACASPAAAQVPLPASPSAAPAAAPTPSDQALAAAAAGRAAAHRPSVLGRGLTAFAGGFAAGWLVLPALLFEGTLVVPVASG